MQTHSGIRMGSPSYRSCQTLRTGTKSPLRAIEISTLVGTRVKMTSSRAMTTETSPLMPVSV
jgi:hypothetical protein